MKNLKSLSILFSLLLMSSCTEYGVSGFKKLFNDTLGIPVIVNASGNDICADIQADALIGDFKRLKKSVKKDVATKLKEKFQSITLNPTIVTKRVTGTVVFLKFVNSDGHKVTEKTILDELQYEGSSPIGEATFSDGNLTLNPESTVDESIGQYYATKDVDAYDIVESIADQKFTEFRQNGEIFFDSENAKIGTKCSTPLYLKDLLEL